MAWLIRFLIYGLLIAVPCVLLVGTRAGLVLLVVLAEGFTLGKLDVDNVGGSLLEGVNWRSLRWQTEGLTAELGPSHFSWRLAKPDEEWQWHLDQADILNIVLLQAESEAAAPSAEIALPQLQLPLSLQVHWFGIGTVTGNDRIVLDQGLISAAHRDETLSIKTLTARLGNQSVDIKGSAATAGAWPLGLKLSALSTTPAQTLQIAVTGTVKNPKMTWQLAGALTGQGRLTGQDTLKNPLLKLQGVLRGDSLAAFDPRLSVSAFDAVLDVSWQAGAIDGFLKLAVAENRLDLRGGLETVTFSLEAPQPWLIMPQLTGQILASGEMANSANDIRHLDASWKALRAGDGQLINLQLGATGTRIAPDIRLKLDHPHTRIETAARLNLESDRQSLAVKTLSWWAGEAQFLLDKPASAVFQADTINAGPFCLAASDGAKACLSANGTLDALNLQAAIASLPLHLLKPWMGDGVWNDAVLDGKLRVDAGTMLALEGLRFRHSNGELKASGTVELSGAYAMSLQTSGRLNDPQQTFTASVEGDLGNTRIDLNASGHVTGVVSAAGNFPDRNVALELDVASGPLSALLPELGSWAPVATGSLQIRGENPEIWEASLNLVAGDDTILIDLERGILDFESAIANLAAIHPALSGRFTGRGEVPVRWQEGLVSVDLELLGALMPDSSPVNARLQANGLVSAHKLNFAAERPDAKIEFDIDGRWDGEQWLGQAKNLVLAHKEGVRFDSQSRVAEIRVAKASWSLSELCLRSSGGGLICAQGQQVDGHWAGKGKLEALPISLFAPWMSLPPWLQIDFAGQWEVDRDQGIAATLTTGSVDIPPMGIAIKANRLNVSGILPGPIKVRTESDFAEGQLLGKIDIETGAVLQLSGSLESPMLTWTNRPELRLKAAPKLAASWREGQAVVLSGNVRTGAGKVNLDKLPASDGPTLSSDIQESGQGAKDSLPLEMDLGLILERPLEIIGYGFDGSAAGSLRVTQRPGGLLKGNGNMSVAGRYKAWGQDLTIRDGRIYFQNSALVDPLVDLTATRDVGKYRVGVQALGAAQSPQLVLISRPAVNDSVALKMLLTGKEPGQQSGSTPDQTQLMQQALASLSVSGGNWFAEHYGSNLPLDELYLEMDEAAGTPGLVLGRQIGPRLYIGYKLLLNRAAQVFQLRYRLNNACDLTATSGNASEGRVGCRLER